MYIHGFDADAGHKLETLHALLHDEYVGGMHLPHDIDTTIHHLLFILLAAWAEYPQYAAGSVLKMREELVELALSRGDRGDDRNRLSEIVGEACKGWTGSSQVSATCLWGGNAGNALKW